MLENQVCGVEQTCSEVKEITRMNEIDCRIPIIVCDKERISIPKCLEAVLPFPIDMFTFRTRRSCRENNICATFGMSTDTQYPPHRICSQPRIMYFSLISDLDYYYYLFIYLFI